MAEQRIIRGFNRDGSPNIIRTGKMNPFDDIYHFLLSISWAKFIALLIALYFLVDLIFGIAYFLVGRTGLTGLQSNSDLQFFTECFFFSVQTFSTIGYGQISPGNLLTNLLVSIQAFIGLLSVGLMSGLFFSRFARPTAKVKFSEIALITNYMGQKSLVIRMANSRFNQIVEASVSLTFAQDVVTPEGISMRVLTDLNLLRNKNGLFALSWTVTHPIDEKSPFYKRSLTEFENSRAEIIVSLLGHDQTFSQTVHARYSYSYKDLVFDRQFADMIKRDDVGIMIDLDKISSLRP